MNIDNHPLRTPWLLAGAAVVLLLPIIILTDLPQRDVLCRYAPMADAIAAGEWDFAFHPRIPPLFPLLAGGIAWLFDCNGFLAAKLASMFCMAVTVFPLYALFRRVFQERTAWIGCILFLFCSYLLRLASAGLRESAKTFGFLWAVYALLVIYQERQRWRGYLMLGVASAWMMAIRDDSVLIAGCLWLAALILELRRFRAVPYRSCAAAGMILLLLAPLLYGNYRSTGYPVPSARFALIASSLIPPYLFGGSPVGKAQESAPATKVPGKTASQLAPSSPSLPPPPEPAPPPPPAPSNVQLIEEFCMSLFKGLYPVFFIPALLVIVLRFRRREWTPSETLLLAALAGHTLLLIAQILIFDRRLFVSRRYLLPAAPLAFGWSALFLEWLYKEFLRRLPQPSGRKVFALCCIALGIGLYCDALAPQLKQRFSDTHAPGRMAVLKWSGRLRREYHGPKRSGIVPQKHFEYRTFRRPLVVCRELPELGYLAGGETLLLTPREAYLRQIDADYLADELPVSAPIPVYHGYKAIASFEECGKRYVLWESLRIPNREGSEK